MSDYRPITEDRITDVISQIATVQRFTGIFLEKIKDISTNSDVMLDGMQSTDLDVRERDAIQRLKVAIGQSLYNFREIQIKTIEEITEACEELSELRSSIRNNHSGVIEKIHETDEKLIAKSREETTRFVEENEEQIEANNAEVQSGMFARNKDAVDALIDKAVGEIEKEHKAFTEEVPLSIVRPECPGRPPVDKYAESNPMPLSGIPAKPKKKEPFWKRLLKSMARKK